MKGHRRIRRENGSRHRMLLNGIKGPTRPERALPLDLRLQAIADNLPTRMIDEVWVFPPLPNRDLACEFLVLVCFDGAEDRRRILTAHVDAQFPDPESDSFEWVQRLREHGTAPHDWLSDMPDRLLQRLSEAGIPEIHEVGGHSEAWAGILERLADGTGNGNGALEPEIPVDSRFTQGIAFSTINETGISGNVTHIEADR